MQPDPQPKLTPQQEHFLTCVAQGYHYAEIAPVMGISVQAVKRLAERACDSMGAHTVTQAAVMAAMQGLLPVLDWVH